MRKAKPHYSTTPSLMSIATKTGDEGETSLMYGRRVPKTDARVEAYGSVDELNAALGLARANAGDTFLAEQILALQNELVVVMGELATATEDSERFKRDGFSTDERGHDGTVDRSRSPTREGPQFQTLGESGKQQGFGAARPCPNRLPARGKADRCFVRIGRI